MEAQLVFRIASILKKIPEDLAVCQHGPSEAETTTFADIRRRYASDPAKARVEPDKIRAFRLLAGMKRYIEIGTFDKFNLRYVMGLLDPEALVVQRPQSPAEIAEKYATPCRTRSP